MISDQWSVVSGQWSVVSGKKSRQQLIWVYLEALFIEPCAGGAPTATVSKADYGTSLSEGGISLPPL